jgi:tetratricopeptide (TPR) repeat protein
LLELANLRIESKKLEEAAGLLRRYVKVSRNAASGYYKLAMVERGLHLMDAAQRDLSVFQTLSKDASTGPYPYQHLFDYLDNRSALSAQDRTQLDLTELKAQIEKHPDQPQDLYLLAETYLKLGKLEESRSSTSSVQGTIALRPASAYCSHVSVCTMTPSSTFNRPCALILIPTT